MARWIAALVLCADAAAVHAFGFAQVARRAEALAAASYQAPPDALPAELKQLAFDDYRRIRTSPDNALWAGHGTAFEVDFFPPGMNYIHPVKINEVSAQGVREIQFDLDAFDYGEVKLDREKLRGAKELGFAGLRLRFTPPGEAQEEVLTFHGASLFRSPGDEQEYGAWARAIAIDTALQSGEEFPRFVEFWIERPARAERHLVVHALLDSPRLTGAYRFVVKPGEPVVQEVRARIFPRAGVGKLGLAPIASMHFSGENAPARADDFRPEVHDSDGLSVQGADGEWIWRPLLNPRRLLVTSFALKDPVGFGLMQRDRAFASYQDPAARRELRPSVWVEPEGRWGAGRVELVQIPSPNEFNNNIVAFWVPDRTLEKGQALDFAYRISWPTTTAPLPPNAWVAQTRRGNDRAANADAQSKGTEELWLRVDFVAAANGAAEQDAAPRVQVAADDNGKILSSRLEPNAALGGWRLTLQLRRLDAAKPVEMRAQLFGADEGNTETPRSEIWSYILPPD